MVQYKNVPLDLKAYNDPWPYSITPNVDSIIEQMIYLFFDNNILGDSVVIVIASQNQ